jgi:WD40 repeat protein
MAALLFGGGACSADNQLGRDDLGGGGGSGSGKAGAGIASGKGGFIGGGGGKAGATFSPKAFQLSSDAAAGELEVATTGGQITVISAADGAELRVIKPTFSLGNGLPVVHASGLVVIDQGDVVWLYKSDGTLLRAIPQPFYATTVALSADGAVLVTGDSKGTLRRFQVGTGAEIQPSFAFNETDADVRSIAISSDGGYLVATNEAKVRIWRTAEGAVTEIPGLASQVVLSATGEVAVQGVSALSFYSLNGTLLGSYPVPYGNNHMAYSPDGKKLAISTRLTSDVSSQETTLVKVIDRTTGAELASLFDEEQLTYHDGEQDRLIGVVFIDDGAVALGWSNRRVKRFGVADGLATWSHVLAQ